MITSYLKFANEYNTFFIRVSKILARNIVERSNNLFETMTAKIYRNQNSIFFHPTNKNKVEIY